MMQQTNSQKIPEGFKLETDRGGRTYYIPVRKEDQEALLRYPLGGTSQELILASGAALPVSLREDHQRWKITTDGKVYAD